jgi:hypothetical protein
MHVLKKIEEEHLELELAIDEISEQFVVNLETDSGNISSDTEPTNNGEISGADPLDS